VKSNRLTVQIIKPVSEVFAFTINPQNTPKWVDTIVLEQTNEWPIKIGSQYRNKTKSGKWSLYDVVGLEENKLFELVARDGNYHVRYTFLPINSYKTEMDYFEWVEEGEIETPFTNEILTKLRMAIEFKNVK